MDFDLVSVERLCDPSFIEHEVTHLKDRKLGHYVQ